jgi:hypothetical protein
LLLISGKEKIKGFSFFGIFYNMNILASINKLLIKLKIKETNKIYAI